MQLNQADPIPFNIPVEMVGVSFDESTSTVTLGEAPYYRIAFGFTVESYTGSPTIVPTINGLVSGVVVPIITNGFTFVEWQFAQATPNSTLRLTVMFGTITLSSWRNAYLNVNGFNVPN